MKTNSKIIGALIAIIIVLFVAFAVLTRPPIPENVNAPFDPLSVAMLKHMEEVEAVSFGTGPDKQVQVQRLENGKIAIHVSDELIGLLGDDTLAKLEIPSQDLTLSQDGYIQFLNRLHDLVAKAFPEKHAVRMDGQDHDNGHEDEHDHDQEDEHEGHAHP